VSTHVVVMGVAGSGKSTVGALLAERIGAPFLDADSLHPEANVAKMSAGTPLDDDDRAPWLAAVAASFVGETPLVIACSALKRSYRDLIRAGAPDAVFVHLHGTPELLAERLGARSAHFMPAALLESQLATLEPLGADEGGFALDLAASPERLVEQASARLV
jgi:carbohydrate kinase (thermoresistant glucokinase family)